MLDGVTPVPAEFAARYRERGYWTDQPLFEGFTGALAKYADRVAVVDEAGPVTYRELSERSAHLARVLLDLGFGPLDRIIVQLPNTAMFAYLYFALQRIGAAPVLALPGHRRREITQFAEISGARALAVPAAARGFDFTAMAAEVMASNPALRAVFRPGRGRPPARDTAGPAVPAPGGTAGTRAARRSAQALAEVSIDPADPALFLLSGGTTGIPKLIPRTHNDYLYNSKIAAAVCEIGEGDVLLDVLPIEHNLPLGCPGLQGFLLSGGTVVLGTSTRPRDVFGLIQRHRVTHIHLVPALLIRWIDDPAITEYDLSSLRVIQSGGQRLQPEVRLRAERALNPLFETIAGLGVPVMIDVGTTGMGAGLPGGLGARLEHARPLAIDNLAARFPALTIVAAHPGWPWTDEMTAVALHKGNVYWELSGWAPKYFPPSLRTDIRGRLREKMMFGSDHPSLPYERILREWDELGYDQSVLDLVFHANAERVLGL